MVLADQGDGYVIADAIKVTPDGALPNTATWTPDIPATKAYRVYARWTAHPNRATDAKYSVTHAGGATDITINQEANNGAWVQLGVFTMSPASGHKVSLTDQANGYVIADAIRLIATDEPEFNTATWSPNVTGQYEVYAKWTANPNRATDAKYTVTHASGAAEVTVNQQANGGQFNLLGTFNLTAGSTVTLSDNANGYVIADAIQLISVGPAPQQIYFMHTDHLNTTRLITNQVGQPVWKWDNTDPFGGNPPDENPSGLGAFVFDLGFPGQRRDRETGNFYNYFRDCYDPATGRYCQSDPIGLAGGINLYAYVGSNPLSRVDPTGQFFQLLVPIIVGVASGTAGVIGGATVVEKINSANQFWVNQNLIPQLQMGQEAARKLCSQGDQSACAAATYFQQRENQCSRELVGAGSSFSNVGNVPGTFGAGREVLTNILRGR